MSRPLPGHSIPYALTQDEISQFINDNIGNAALNDYLTPFLTGMVSGANLQPPYGIIVTGAYGQYSVWVDASNVLHVTDVTNMPIVAQIQKAPYVSPDSSVVQNIMDELKALAAKAVTGAEIVAALLALYFIAQIRKGK